MDVITTARAIQWIDPDDFAHLIEQGKRLHDQLMIAKKRCEEYASGMPPLAKRILIMYEIDVEVPDAPKED